MKDIFVETNYPGYYFSYKKLKVNSQNNGSISSNNIIIFFALLTNDMSGFTFALIISMLNKNHIY